MGISLNLLIISCSFSEESPSNIPEVTLEKETADTNSTIQSRDKYRAINLKQLSSNAPLVGMNPQEIALQTFGAAENNQPEKLFQEIVGIEGDNPSNIIVSITQIGLADDSIKGIRYRIDFQPYNKSSSESQWQMTWAGQQFICQPGRGNQNWTADFCY